MYVFENIGDMIRTIIMLGILICLIVIGMGVQELIVTVNDKGINMHMHQRISTDYCSFDVTAQTGTTINMKGGCDEEGTGSGTGG